MKTLENQYNQVPNISVGNAYAKTSEIQYWRRWRRHQQRWRWRWQIDRARPIGQAWANLNDSDDENDDDDKTMIEAGKSDASLAYMALFS